MSMDGDVGNAVGSAAMIGLAIGLQRQRDKAAGSWEHYAHQLERQLNGANRLIDEKTGQIFDLEIASRRQNELLAQREAQLRQREAQLQQRDAEVAREKKRAEGLSGTVISLTKQLGSKKKSYAHLSKSTATLHYLYEQLIDEINRISDPANFTSLDAAAREEVIRTKMEELEKTNEFCDGYPIDLKPPKR